MLSLSLRVQSDSYRQPIMSAKAQENRIPTYSLPPKFSFWSGQEKKVPAYLRPPEAAPSSPLFGFKVSESVKLQNSRQDRKVLESAMLSIQQDKVMRLICSKRFEEAEEMILKLGQDCPINFHGYFIFGCIEAKQFDRAIAYVRERVSDSNVTGIFHQAAKCYCDRQNYSTALEILKACHSEDYPLIIDVLTASTISDFLQQ